MAKAFLKYIVLIISYVLIVQAMVYADQLEIQSSPNYLIILVHGINSSSRLFVGADRGDGKGEMGGEIANEPDDNSDFGDLKGYLENNLGLKGYVYSYTFSQRDGKIDLMARELGDPNWDNKAYIEGGWKYLKNAADIPPRKTKITDMINEEHQFKGNSWFKQAREDFKSWYASRQHPKIDPKDVPESVIPNKYILIAHSLGGLASRDYISSNYYQNDVSELITLASQHKGSDSALALERLYNFYHNNEDVGAFEQLIGLTLLSLWAGQDDIARYCAFSGYGLFAGRQIIDEFVIKGYLGWYPIQPGVQDVDSHSQFMNNLNSADLVKGNQPMKVRFITSSGVPTPSGDLPANRYIFGLSAIQTLFSADYFNELPLGAKVMALYLSEALGAILNQNGDIYSNKKSQSGDGLSKLTASNIDFSSYSLSFGNDSGALEDALAGTAAVFTAINVASILMPPHAVIVAKFAAAMVGGSIAISGFQDRFRDYLSAHGLVLRKAYESGVIDKALDGILPVGGNVNTQEAIHGISASSVNTPTASFPPPSQIFSLLSDLDSDKKSTGIYHSVTIEAITEGNLSSGIFFPIEFNGQKKWVSAITVKDAPTAIKGVINTFLPKKLKQFQYSENFSAWKDIAAVDEWGNFTIKDLKLAEGQNVIAFRAESWTGNKSNQHLKIILNTIPQYVSRPIPEPDSYTANVNQLMAVEANKSNYTPDPSEAIRTIYFQLDGVELLDKISIIASQETHSSHIKAEYTPQSPLSPGGHSVLVKFQSNVGISQAMWNFTVDTTAPTVTVATLEPYAPRSPTAQPLTIKYQTADDCSQFLKNISLRLYKGTTPNEDDNFVTEITTVATQAAGEQFVTWDGKDASGNYVEDGLYTIKIKAFDQAGNYGSSTAQVKIDSTPPQIIEAQISPNPMTKASNGLGFSGKVSEKSMLILKLTNLANNQSSAYLTQGSGADDHGQFPVAYNWQFDDPFIPNLSDGVYKLEITARDEAGNESAPYTINNIKIDRTPPVIFAQYTDPFVLSNTGTNPYHTLLHYQLSESNDDPGNRQGISQPLQVNLKVFNENTGHQIDFIGGNGSLSSENVIDWDGSNPSVPKGSYKFQLTAYDGVGNYSTAYVTCVKGGVAPTISYPVDAQEVSGTVIIRGTAMDPDWTNDLSFSKYKVSYQKLPGGTEQTDLIEVPEIYRDPQTNITNQSIRPVQNDATLAYFHTNSLENGSYAVKVVAEEEGGATYSSTRIITVKNDGIATSGANPTVALSDLPSEINFNTQNSLPIGFTYGGKDINAYLEILKMTNSGSRETVYYKYFPGLTASYYSGRPDYRSGNELGYFIWQDENGWHVRWNGESGREHRFSGTLVASGGISNFTLAGEGGASQLYSIVRWDKKLSGTEGGFDFKASSGTLIITSQIDDDPNTYDDDISSMATPFFGMAKYQPSNSPVIISGLTAQNGAAGQSINWDGKTASGGFVDNGNYVVRVRAEGADGSGLTMVEKNLKITTPFEITNLVANTSSFSPVGLPDRVTVSYNLSKDAQIRLKVYKVSDSNPIAIIDNGAQLGRTNPDYPLTISWQGNYPDKASAQVVTAGEYILKVEGIPVDGSETIERAVGQSVRVDTGLASNSPFVKLDPIGNEVRFNGSNVRATQGSSDYYWDATATGTYYPPINYNSTLGLQGIQKVSLYPYVPFAGLLHRGFKEVDTKVKVTMKIHAWNHYLGAEDNWLLGKFWNPFKWRREWEERVVEKWLDVNDLPGINTKGLIFKEGDQEKNFTFEFDTNDWWHQSGWDWHWGKPNYGSGIDFVEISVEAYSKDNTLLLDSSFNWQQPNTANIATSKGIFKTSYEGRTYSTTYDTTLLDGTLRPCSYGSYHIDITLKLESPIAYSRLTNRFVPWFGFVNNTHSSYESFSRMNQYLSKLGFPGRDYFTDALKTITTYKNEIAGQYDPDVYSPAAYKNEGKLVKSSLDNLTKSNNMPGDTQISAQDSYLSGEYTEFIPITEPERGSFNYLGGIVEREGSGKIILKNRLTAYPIEANTDYRIPYENSTKQVLVKWPNDWAEINAKNQTLLSTLAGLIREPQGYTIGNTAYEIDTAELRTREAEYLRTRPELSINNGWFKRNDGQMSGILRFDKSQIPNRYYKEQGATLGALINPPQEYLTSYTYQILDKYPLDLNYGFNANDLNSGLVISTTRSGQPWSTSDDPALTVTGGKLRSNLDTFNAEGFRADGKSRELYFWKAYKDNYLNYHNYSSADSNKYTFWSADPLKVLQPSTTYGNLIDNPNLVITNWQISPKDAAGQTNQDLEVKNEDIKTYSNNNLAANFKVKLLYEAKEKRLVKLTGHVNSPYELMFFDGSSWIKIADGVPAADGSFSSFWDVGRMCGKYTVLIKTGSAFSPQDIYIGDVVYYGIDTPDNRRVTSAYKRAEVFFKPTSFSKDEFSSVTPVTMSSVFIRNKPILITHGPIVELKPSPASFKTPQDGTDLRPYLRFLYTADDLKEGYDIVTSPSDPNWKAKTQDLWIHQVTANGDLELVQDKNQALYADADGNQYFAFEAAMGHFSTYTLLNGKFKLSAPIVLASRYITNQDTVTIYGTAEPGSVLSLYVKTENVPPQVEQSEPYFARISAEARTGNYKFDNVSLLREGENYIYVTSHLGDKRDVRTYSEVTIIKDVTPPQISATPSLYAFSPNNDGKYDSVDYYVKSNEKGKIYLQLTANAAPAGGQGLQQTALLNEEVATDPNKEYRINWSKSSVKVYQPGITTNWNLLEERAIPSNYSDGEYIATVYGIDEAGNVSNNVINKTIVDTTPPVMLGMSADPNPFTPNEDGIKDTTKFWYKFSEPVYATLNIVRDDGAIFRSHEGPTESFAYPTSWNRDVQSQVPSSGSWVWDGRGARNELIGGNYTFGIAAEDWVGNLVSTEAKTIVVDRVPTLIPYAYAEPDPFAPVNSNNSFTEIKYYLGRDNLKVNLWVVGQEGKTVKSLVKDTIQGKGEHVIRWYGDFDGGYTGPTTTKNNYRVADGSYEFRIRAQDMGEAAASSAEVTNTVLVDNLPPNILVKNLAINYSKKQATLTYSIPENSSVGIELYDKDQNYLASLATAESKPAGDNSYFYDFSSLTAEERQNAGQRLFQITAVDRARNQSVAASAVFSVNPDQFRISNCYAIPATFTPNGDGFTDLTRIAYSISGGNPEYKVSVSILSSTGATIKRLVDGETQTSGTYSFYWDGKSDSQQLSTDGFYEYVIAAEDKVGARVEGRGIMLVVATRPSVDLNANYTIFSPNGDGSKDTVKFNYAINYPLQYISGEALVKLEVLSASGEAVWSKIFNHTARSYYYEWNGIGDNQLSVAGGQYYVRISGQDALGSTAVPKLVPLAVDYSQPEPTDFVVDPAYAKLGTKVAINLTFPETLAEDPTVTLQRVDGTLSNVSLEAKSGNAYTYAYTVTDYDPEGVTNISVEAKDLAYNPISKNKAFVIDKTKPLVSSVSVNPNPASTKDVSGPASIKFNVSEPLQQVPTVYVTQSGANSQLAIVDGQWSTANGLCEAIYEPFTGYDGSASISFEVTDLAGNQASYQTNNLLTIDTIKPVISGIKSLISSNPEFTTFAKEGSEVTLNFNVSEPLKFNPTVKINEQPAAYSSQLTASNETEYIYKYNVSSSDLNGNADIKISALDFAANEGTAETASSAESFVIDLQSPTVAIADPAVNPELIANPARFSTNANPDGSDMPRSTELRYQLAEYSKVTVKVYKVGDSQTTYTKADFNDNNLITTLVSDQWQQANIPQTVHWSGSIEANRLLYDANNDHYADPGKYAFIVEGRDRSGNLTLKKWGGTVWIQNNVLSLREPEQLEYKAASLEGSNNPDPHYISPNGNSVVLNQKRAKYYFMIAPSLNPQKYDQPERIEAQEILMQTKKMGKYSLKVYSDQTMTNLVRTITTEADAWSGTLTWEYWDGKDNTGHFVPDGIYWMVVDVKDFAGNPAENNLLKRPVVIDNTLPGLSNLSVSNYYFCAGKTTDTDPAKRDTTISYRVTDNNAKVKLTIDILKNNVHKITLLDVPTLDANANYTKVWSGEGYDVDGAYTYHITAVDLAGNLISAEGQAVLDQTPPFGSIKINNDVTYTIAPAVTLNLTYGDATSGASQMRFSNDGSTWSSWESVAVTKSWNMPGADGTKSVYVSYSDKAGNYVYKNDSIILDTVNPYFSWINIDPTHTPLNSWSTHTTPHLTFFANDATAGMDRAVGYIDNVAQSDPNIYSNGFWEPTLPDGTYILRLRAYDKAGRYTDSANYTFKIDNTAPNAPILSASETPAGVWSNHNSPIISWSDPGDGNGSGISYYEGYIDNVYQGQVSSGWHPTLSEGQHAIFVRAVDGVGYTKDSAPLTFYIDTVAPAISDLPSKTFNPYVDINVQIDFTASDADPSSGFSRSNISAKIKYGSNNVKVLDVIDDSNGNYHVLWDGTNGPDYENEGDYTLEVSASDGIGNPAITKTTTIYLRDDQRIDHTGIVYAPESGPPSMTDPYLTIDGNFLMLKWVEGIDDTQDDPNSPAHASAAQDWWGTGWGDWVSFFVDHDQNVMLTLSSGGNVGDQAMQWDIDDSAHVTHDKCDLSNPKVVWMTTGTHRIRAYVAANAVPGHHFTDVYAYYKDRKFIQYNRTSLDLGKTWGSTFGPNAINRFANLEISAVSSDPTAPDIGPDVYTTSNNFFIGRTQTVVLNLSAAGLVYAGRRSYAIVDANTDKEVWLYDDIYPSTEKEVTTSIEPGEYYLKVRACAAKVTIPMGYGTWSYTSAATTMKIQYESQGKTRIAGNAVWSSNGEIWFRRGTSSVKITNSGGSCTNPCLVIDTANNDAYVAWQRSWVNMLGETKYSTYFQKVPHNFARLTGSALGASVKVRTNPVQLISTNQATLEAPALISPAGDPRLETRRPTFEWKAPKGVYKDFKATWAKNGIFSDPTQIGESPLRQENIHGTTKPEDPTHVYFGYSIPYIDPALELYPTSYQWKVSATPITGGSAVESNIESFSCEPELEISGITNYPNPCNPNKESTKIRYKLSKDVDEVKIRIYDITGSLVTEIMGDTRGEGSSIMTKYDDVAWDGRNGRGDMVMNGIYPFEVIAKSGNKSVSGRGKIAVLK